MFKEREDPDHHMWYHDKDKKKGIYLCWHLATVLQINTYLVEYKLNWVAQYYPKLYARYLKWYERRYKNG